MGWQLAIGVALVLVGGMLSAADRKGGEERREAERIQAARQDLAEAEKKVNAAQEEERAATQGLAGAEQRQEEAISALREARERVERRLEEKLGIAQAIAAHQAAEKKYQALATPILNRLKQTAEYQATVVEAAKARTELQRLGKLPREQTAVASAERETLVAVAQQPGQLEKRALDAERSVAEARQGMLEVQARIAALRAEVHSGVDGDAQVQAALRAAENMKEKVAQQKQTLARKRGQLEQARNRATRARQAVAAAERANRKDDRQDRKPKKR